MRRCEPSIFKKSGRYTIVFSSTGKAKRGTSVISDTAVLKDNRIYFLKRNDKYTVFFKMDRTVGENKTTKFDGIFYDDDRIGFKPVTGN